MTEHPPPSGSRWEPADPADPAAARTEPAADADTVRGQPTAVDQEAAAYAAEPATDGTGPAPVVRPKRFTRGRLLLAGGALAIAGVAGVGGFAAGHAVGGNDGSTAVVDQDGRMDGDFPFGDRGGPPDLDGDGAPDAPPEGVFPDGPAPDGTAPDETAPDTGTTPDSESGAASGTGSVT